MVIADLGAGEGTFSQLLARRSKKVIAVDNSDKMLEYGRELALKHGVKNLEYRKGDLEAVPIRDGAVDLAFFSQALHHTQHPDRAVAEALRILKPGGRIVVLDLLRHNYEEASCTLICGSVSPKWSSRDFFAKPGSRTSRRRWCTARETRRTLRRSWLSATNSATYSASSFSAGSGSPASLRACSNRKFSVLLLRI
jgi:ubiquinone/menaquinone biosynthesis C-methylase UbiE